jgi:hypothetical protein
MDIVKFAVWKFRYIEGILRGMQSFNMTTTKYVDPVSKEVSWIRYDINKEIATIECASTQKLECNFSDLVHTLKDLGMYQELPPGEHHMLAGQQKDE